MQILNFYFAVRLVAILVILGVAFAVVPANASTHLPDCKADANCFSQSVESPTNVATAESYDKEILAFKGIDSVWVVVEDIVGDCPQFANAEDSFKTQIELKLRQNGIKVVSQEEYPRLIAAVTIDLALSAIQLPDTQVCLGDISFELRDRVRLFRNNAFISNAEIWNSGAIWFGPSNGAKEVVKNSVDEKIDEFLNAYLRANPRP